MGCEAKAVYILQIKKTGPHALRLFSDVNLILLKEESRLTKLMIMAQLPLEKLIVPQLFKKYPAFCGTQILIVVYKRARHFVYLNLLTKTVLAFGNSPPLRAQNLIDVLTRDQWNLA